MFWKFYLNSNWKPSKVNKDANWSFFKIVTGFLNQIIFQKHFKFQHFKNDESETETTKSTSSLKAAFTKLETINKKSHVIAMTKLTKVLRYVIFLKPTAISNC